MALDSYAAFALKVHIIEHLRLHIFSYHCIRAFKQTVGKRRLSVIDMSYNAEIPYILHL